MRSQILAGDVSFHMKHYLLDQYQNWSFQRPLSLIGSFWTPPRLLNWPKSPHRLGLKLLHQKSRNGKLNSFFRHSMNRKWIPTCFSDVPYMYAIKLSVLRCYQKLCIISRSPDIFLCKRDSYLLLKRHHGSCILKWALQNSGL